MKLRIPAIWISVLGAAVAWEVVALLEFVPQEYFPTLHQTLAAFGKTIRSGELLFAWLNTCGRAAWGLLLSTLLGLGVALLTARYQLLRRAFDPLAEFLRPLPPAAIVPMSIFFLGLGWKLYGFILIFACFWPIYLAASTALGSVSRVQLASGRSLGCGPWSLLLQIQLPAALPDIFIAIRLAAGIALIATVVTEMLAGRDGIGHFLVDASFSLRTPEMFACLLAAMLSGILFNQLAVSMRRIFCGWHEGLTGIGREE